MEHKITTLKLYNELNSIKPPYSRAAYPYSTLNNIPIKFTHNILELWYDDYKKVFIPFNPVKKIKGAGISMVLVI